MIFIYVKNQQNCIKIKIEKHWKSHKVALIIIIFRYKIVLIREQIFMKL